MAIPELNRIAREVHHPERAAPLERRRTDACDAAVEPQRLVGRRRHVRRRDARCALERDCPGGTEEREQQERAQPPAPAPRRATGFRGAIASGRIARGGGRARERHPARVSKRSRPPPSRRRTARTVGARRGVCCTRGAQTYPLAHVGAADTPPRANRPGRTSPYAMESTGVSARRGRGRRRRGIREGGRSRRRTRRRSRSSPATRGPRGRGSARRREIRILPWW